MLDTGQDSIEIEARASSVWVKSHRWASPSSGISFVRLPQSSSTKQVLCFLTPEEPFRIGDTTLVLRSGHVSPDQEVQVMSSRPSDTNDADSRGENEQDPTPRLDNRPSTPTAASGSAIMETPIANRYQSFFNPGKSLATSMVEDTIKNKEDSQSWGHDPLRRDVMTTLRDYTKSDTHSQRFESPELPELSAAYRTDQTSPVQGASTPTKAKAVTAENGDVSGQQNGDHAGIVIDLESGPVEKNLDSVPDDQNASQTTEGSSDEQPQPKTTVLSNEPQMVKESLLAPRGPNKRSASPALDQEDLDEEAIPQAGRGTDSSSLESGRSKRRKPLPSKGTEESQNSIRSTIYVEVPPNTHSQGSAEHSRRSPAQDTKQSQELSKSHISTPRNQIKSNEPPSSNLSSRSTRQGQRGEDGSQDQVTKVLYTSSTGVGQANAYSRFLRQNNIRQVKSINDCDILCTGKGELKRTFKLLLAILMGKEIVTDEWVIQGTTRNKVLNTSDFVPEDTSREREWGTSLADAIGRGRQCQKPLDGYTVNFTPSAKKELGKSWSELKEICLVAGATAVQAMIPRKSSADSDTTILIAASNETDQSTLEERGWKIFTKDIITFSVLRGRVDLLSDEFQMAKKAKGSAKKPKKTK